MLCLKHNRKDSCSFSMWNLICNQLFFRNKFEKQSYQHFFFHAVKLFFIHIIRRTRIYPLLQNNYQRIDMKIEKFESNFIFYFFDLEILQYMFQIKYNLNNGNGFLCFEKIALKMHNEQFIHFENQRRSLSLIQILKNKFRKQTFGRYEKIFI